MAQAILLVTLFISFVVNALCISPSSQQGTVRSKSIKTKYGIFECINFYEQPSFSHPLLKNLTSTKLNFTELQKPKIRGDFGLKDGCPLGTVPILRTKSNSYEHPQLSAFSSNDKQTNCVAVVRTTNTAQKFYGVDGSISIYKPRAQPSQWSSGRVKVINGKEAIEAGWMVNFDMYKDYEAHLYTIFTNGATRIQTPGFVQVSKDVPLGYIPERYTVPREKPVYWNISISKNLDGNWWLTLFGSEQYDIGYWPKQLFTRLAESANQVDFGGEIDAGTTIMLGPDMGTGRKATESTDRSAFVAHVTVIDQDFDYNVIPRPTEKYMNCEQYYTVVDAGYISEYLGELMFFGGPSNPS